MNKETIAMKARLEGAFKDRALYLALLYRSFQKVLPAEQVEKSARDAIFEYGRLKGMADGVTLSAEEWTSRTPCGEESVFGTRVEQSGEDCREIMSNCPLVDAWREMGCTPEEIALFCDIAMEVDRGRAAFHGLGCELTRRIGQGDRDCCLVLTNPRD